MDFEVYYAAHKKYEHVTHLIAGPFISYEDAEVACKQYNDLPDTRHGAVVVSQNISVKEVP